MLINTRWPLADNHEIPLIGFGLYLITPGAESQQSIQAALHGGYRHFDSATLYKNEKDLGIAIRESDIPREDIFIATKLWNDDHGYDETKRAFETSLNNLRMEYVDLYLIHWPVPEKRLDSWKALISLKQEGRVKSIGVSNYTIKHLQELIDMSAEIPAVNQVEFHPFLYQKELLKYCQQYHIQLEAYSPLTRGKKIHHPTLVEIAKKYQKTAPQIMLRWCLQHHIVPLAKSSHPARIFENIQLFDFEINEEDMACINSLNQNLHIAWDPTNTP